MDLHTLITWALTLAVVVVLVVRTRAKRSDRKRDANVPKPDRRDDGPSLY